MSERLALDRCGREPEIREDPSEARHDEQEGEDSVVRWSKKTRHDREGDQASDELHPLGNDADPAAPHGSHLQILRRRVGEIVLQMRVGAPEVEHGVSETFHCAAVEPIQPSDRLAGERCKTRSDREQSAVEQQQHAEIRVDMGDGGCSRGCYRIGGGESRSGHMTVAA